MKNIFALIRKNVFLIKKYIIIFLIYTLVLPYLFVNIVENKSELIYWMISFIELFIMSTVLTNIIEVADENNRKVLHLLCVAPYSREEIVLSKYIFDYIIFIFYWLLIVLESIISKNNFLHVNFLSVALTLLLCNIYRGIMLPFQFKFGYSKTKNIFTMVSFVFIFGIPIMINLLDMSNLINGLNKITFFQINYYIQCLILYVVAIGITIISYLLSAKIFNKKDLI